MILRHRRRGSYVNPHWLRTNTSFPELRLIVPEGPWGAMLRAAADERDPPQHRRRRPQGSASGPRSRRRRGSRPGRGGDRFSARPRIRHRRVPATARRACAAVDRFGVPRRLSRAVRRRQLVRRGRGRRAGRSRRRWAVVPASKCCADAGLDVPRTWSDFAAAARAVADRGDARADRAARWLPCRRGDVVLSARPARHERGGGDRRRCCHARLCRGVGGDVVPAHPRR